MAECCHGCHSPDPHRGNAELRYAHLYDDPLRAGLNQVGDMLRPKLVLVVDGAGESASSAFGREVDNSRTRPI